MQLSSPGCLQPGTAHQRHFLLRLANLSPHPHMINMLRFCTACCYDWCHSIRNAYDLLDHSFSICLSVLSLFLHCPQSKLHWRWQMSISRRGWSLGPVKQEIRGACRGRWGWLKEALVLKEPWAVLEALKIPWLKAWFSERSKDKISWSGQAGLKELS